MINKVILVGNLGADPEVRYMPNGDPIATLRLATTRRWKDRNTNERKEETEWHRVTFFGALGKTCGSYLKKGSKIYVEGRIKTEKYQKNGVDTYTTGIVGEVLTMLDGKSDAGNQQQPQQQHQPRQSQPDYSDDVPF